MRLAWISQGGFLFCGEGGARVVVDPYMSDDLKRLGHFRMSPPPISYADLKPSAVIFTHDHLDHYDPVTVAEILRLYPDCILSGPTSVCEHHKKLGYDVSKFRVLNVGDCAEFFGLKFTGVKARHSDALAEGFLIDDGKTLAYLSSDTLYEPSLSGEILAARPDGRQIDFAMVCINGKLGNMPWRDAVNLVREISPRLAMPMHYGLFADNTEDPEPFVAAIEAAGINAVVPQAGEFFVV